MAPDTEFDSKAEVATTTPYVVVLYNDDFHTIDEVVLQLQKATGQTQDVAQRITLEAHTKGKSVAWRAGLEDCQRVAAVLRQIRLQVEVDEG